MFGRSNEAIWVQCHKKESRRGAQGLVALMKALHAARKEELV